MSDPGKVTPRMGLVYFAFGAAEVGASRSLAGPILLRLLADLGLSESAARSLLLRMRHDGLLSSKRDGRTARYRLAPAVYAAQARLERQLRGQRPAWTGSFHGVLYEVPEVSRAYRDRLRRTAHLLGYAMLRPGLLIATTDRSEELRSLLPDQPTGSQVLWTQITLEADDSRRVAADLWDLERLADRYRAVLAESRERIDRARGAHSDHSFGAFAAATLPLFETAASDPDLPAALLPPNWPGNDVGAAIGSALEVFGPMIGQYVRGLSGRH
ncbi:MAG: PaaX family transcriptional regulator C-terminal domain-containing protein [Acidimicrobiales bacterium]